MATTPLAASVATFTTTGSWSSVMAAGKKSTPATPHRADTTLSSLSLSLSLSACSVWQHVECITVNPNNLPDKYLCEVCHPRSDLQYHAPIIASWLS